MSDMETIKREIADGERWLEQVCPRRSIFDATGVRQAVRLAVQEAWLARQDGGAMSDASMDRIKGAVRREVVSRTLKVGRPRRWLWAAGSMSAAALIALAVFTAEAPVITKTPEVGGESLVANFGALDAWDATLDEEIDSLREALGELDDSKGDSWMTDWETWGEDGSSGT